MKYTLDIFLKKAHEVHGDKYDYSKVEYVNSQTKVCIICPKHGEFWQRPNDHLNGHGCPKCTKKHKYTTEEWVEEAKKVHRDKYDYSKVVYKGAFEEVCIICPIHGEFWQKPYSHLNGRGCRKCKYEKSSKKKNMGVNLFIKRAKKIHGDRYDYSKVEYIDSNTKVCIICPIHGEFWQTPSNHLSKHGCPTCAKIERGKKKRKTKELFISQSKKIHNDKYDYSSVEYTNSHTKICIICPKHGIFFQRPYDHLNGHGCPSCENSVLEEMVRKELTKNNILFEEYYCFEWLINEETKYPYKLDFYLPKYDVAIECQGIQHFKPIKFFGGEKNLRYNIKRDLDKKKLCHEHNVRLLYFLDEKYNDYLDKTDIFFNNTKNLIEYILNYGKNNT